MPAATLEALRPHGEKQFEDSNVTKAKHEIIEAIRNYDTVVINAGTGSGKSLFGPVHVLEGMEQENGGKPVRMLIGEPRRFLAKGNSEKVAKINHKQIGGDYVGYYYKGERKVGDDTRLTFTVNGSIRNLLQKDITLPGYDAVFLDEIHLREIDQYAIRMGLKKCQEERAAKGMKPLKVIIASADATARDGEYHGNDKYLEVLGTKPQEVHQRFQEAVPLLQSPKEMARIAARIVKDKTRYGDVLGFLPGRAEILEAQKEFNRIMKEEGLDQEYKSGLLTGGGGKENEAIQDQLLAGRENNRNPLVIFGTDVAETGANFPWLTKVIDAGYSRIPVYDQETGITRLLTVPSAYANYKQRLGRLGRDAWEGEFYGMYAEEDMNNLAKHPAEQQSSIMKSDLTQLVLSLKDMGLTDVYELDYPDRPTDSMLDRAVKTLKVLDALKDDGSLSDDGKILASLPMDARFGKMFVEAKKHGCTEAMGALYGFMNTNKSVYSRLHTPTDKLRDLYATFADPDSDYITLLNVWNAYLAEKNKSDMTENGLERWALQNGFDYEVLKEVDAAKIDLADTAWLNQEAGLGDAHKIIDISGQKHAIMDAVLSGFKDKLLKRTEDNVTFAFVDGERKNVRSGSASGIMASTPYIISGEFRGGKTEGQTLYASLNQVVSESKHTEIFDQLTKINTEMAAASEERGVLAAANAVQAAEKIFEKNQRSEEKITEEHAAVEAVHEIVNAHADERKEAEVLADIHKEAEKHDESHHTEHDENANHGTYKDVEMSFWNDFKQKMKDVGYTASYPIRSLWDLFKKLLGKVRSRDASHH